MRFKKRLILLWTLVTIFFLLFRLNQKNIEIKNKLILKKLITFNEIFNSSINFKKYFLFILFNHFKFKIFYIIFFRQFQAIDDCSMTECFNWTKCLAFDQLKIYIYPLKSNFISPIYEKILKILKESYLFTDDPNAACLFFLSIDTIDRDKSRFFFLLNY